MLVEIQIEILYSVVECQRCLGLVVTKNRGDAYDPWGLRIGKWDRNRTFIEGGDVLAQSKGDRFRDQSDSKPPVDKPADHAGVSSFVDDVGFKSCTGTNIPDIVMASKAAVPLGDPFLGKLLGKDLIPVGQRMGPGQQYANMVIKQRKPVDIRGAKLLGQHSEVTSPVQQFGTYFVDGVVFFLEMHIGIVA